MHPRPFPSFHVTQKASRALLRRSARQPSRATKHLMVGPTKATRVPQSSCRDLIRQDKCPKSKEIWESNRPPPALHRGPRESVSGCAAGSRRTSLPDESKVTEQGAGGWSCISFHGAGFEVRGLESGWQLAGIKKPRPFPGFKIN